MDSKVAFLQSTCLEIMHVCIWQWIMWLPSSHYWMNTPWGGFLEQPLNNEVFSAEEVHWLRMLLYRLSNYQELKLNNLVGSWQIEYPTLQLMRTSISGLKCDVSCNNSVCQYWDLDMRPLGSFARGEGEINLKIQDCWTVGLGFYYTKDVNVWRSHLHPNWGPYQYNVGSALWLWTYLALKFLTSDQVSCWYIYLCKYCKYFILHRLPLVFYVMP